MRRPLNQIDFVQETGAIRRSKPIFISVACQKP